MSKEWRTWNDCYRYYRDEGFELAVIECKVCRVRFNSAFFPGSDTTKLQCPICMQQDSRLIRRIELGEDFIRDGD